MTIKYIITMIVTYKQLLSFLNIHRHRSSIMAFNAMIKFYVVVICGALHAQHTLKGLRLRRVIGGGGGGGRKLASTIPPAVGSAGVVGSSSAPSVCGIPPSAGEEGMSGASAVGEITILRFLLLLVCTPVCGVTAAAAAAAVTAAAAGREVNVACHVHGNSCSYDFSHKSNCFCPWTN